MRVTLYQRFPQHANFSIERLFLDVRKAFPASIDATVAVSRFRSQGLWRRVYNTLEAVFRQAEVNHITGDVHYLAFLLKKRRTLLTVHDLATLHRLKGMRRKVYFFLWFWLPIRRVSIVTVISEATKQDLMRNMHIAPHKVRVVHDCASVDFTRFARKFNADKPVILHVGTGQNKNLVRVAEALKGLSCHLRIIGRLNPAQESALVKFGIEYSVVSNISDSEIVAQYRECDMLLFASLHEGFGLPILEAQATGRPVVTSNISAMPEVAGNAACLVNPYDVESIRAGVEKVIALEAYRDELISCGFLNVERFRSEKIARDYVSIYNELASGD